MYDATNAQQARTIRLRWCLQGLTSCPRGQFKAGTGTDLALRTVGNSCCCQRDRLQHVPCWSVSGRQRKFHVQNCKYFCPAASTTACGGSPAVRAWIVPRASSSHRAQA